MTLSPGLLAVVSSVLGGVIWGAWAFYINFESPRVYWSAVTQFVSSMLVTALMSVIVIKTQSVFKETISRVLFPALVSSSFAIAILLASHSIARTENLLLTIAAPALVGFVYCLFYSYKINNKNEAIR